MLRPISFEILAPFLPALLVHVTNQLELKLCVDGGSGGGLVFQNDI